MVILGRVRTAKIAPKHCSKYLKVKQHFNCILIIINQNILALLRAFVNLKRKIYEKLYTKQTSTAATTEFLSKIPDRKKISNDYFIFVRRKSL